MITFRELRSIFLVSFSLLIFACGGGGNSTTSSSSQDDSQQSAGAVIVSHDDLVAVVGNSVTSTTTSPKIVSGEVSHALVNESPIMLNVPYISQFEVGPDEHNINCGPASYLMLRSFHYQIDIGRSHADAWSYLKNMIDWMGPQSNNKLPNIDGYYPPQYGSDKYTGDYTSNSQMKQLLEKEGEFSAQYIEPTLEGLRSELVSGNPVLVIVSAQGGNNTELGDNGVSKLGTMKQSNVQHWMVVVGIDNNYVYVNDPGRTWGFEAYANKRGFTRQSFLNEWIRIGKINPKINQGKAIGLRVTKRNSSFKVGIDEGSLSSCPFLSVNKAFSLVLSAVDGTPPYTWSISKGNLPPGISLSKGGVISGIPSQSGSYQFTVSVSDSVGDVAERDSAIFVDNSSLVSPISITTAKNLSAGKIGANYYFHLSVLGGSWPYSWQISQGTLPPGLSLNASGEISGTPTNTGIYQFKIQVSDSNLQKAEKDLVISVMNSIIVTPAIAMTPMSAKQGATLSEWGTGFSPNSTAILHFRKPDGSEFSSLSQSIKSDGSFSITYTIPSGQTPGTYTWWGSDGPTGKTSNSVSYTVTEAVNVTPAIAMTPMSAKQGATLSEWGTGFSPNSTAILHFRKPDGSEFSPLSQSIKSDGSFSIAYTIPTDQTPGTYSWWGVDSSGKTSNTVNYTVIAAQVINPTVAQTPMSAKQGDTLSEWGTGFTPSSTATLHFKKPDGTEFATLAQPIKADGTFSITYTIPIDRTPGTYPWWGVDSTGKVSNTVSYTVSQAINPQVAVTPTTAKQGDTLSEWGTGFTPSSTATLHFKKPDGTEFPTATQAIKADGSFSMTYTIPIDRTPGTYTWWGIDSSGKVSNTASYTVTAAYNINPTIAISPTSGPAGTTFVEWGTGFTPNSTATLYFPKYDGVNNGSSQIAIDSIGHFEISYPSGTNKPKGSYSWYAKDGPTGKLSNTVTYKIN